MNMMQEEVTKRLKALKARCERLIVSSSAGNPEEWRKDAEALDFAFTALRPVSREQVEKVWKGHVEALFTAAWCRRRAVQMYKVRNDTGFRNSVLRILWRSHDGRGRGHGDGEVEGGGRR